MKRLFFVILLCAMLVVLSACGNVENPTEAPTEEITESLTEAPFDAPGKETAEDVTETPTEPAVDEPITEPSDTPATAWGDNSDVRDDLAYYTVELTKTVYTTEDVGVRYRFRAKNPGYTGFSDNWRLYKFVDGEKIYVGSNPLETALELSPSTEDGYVDCEMSFSFRYIYTSGMQQLDTLEVGRYCLEMHRGNYENGAPIVVARLSFEVIPAEQLE